MNFDYYLMQLFRFEYFIVFEICILMIVFICYTHGRVLARRMDEHKAYILHFVSVFGLFFVIPLITLFIYGKNPVQFGICLGDWRKGLFWIGVGVIVAVIIGAFSPNIEEMRQQYPLSKKSMDNPRKFIRYEILYLFLFYTGWEFLFRGFMLFALVKIDPLLGIILPTIPTVLLHIGHPKAEMWATVVAGIMFGYIAYVTGSVLYPWLIHALIGIVTDTTIYIHTKRKAAKSATE